MRVAVISDIHANLRALEAVLFAIDEERPDAIWCLGDLVGYGPRPNECVAVVRERAQICLVGNHDLIAIGDTEVTVDAFNPDAAAAARWTEAILGEQSRAFLAGLTPSVSAAGVELYHGSPLDPVWEYVLTEHAARSALEATHAEVVLVGHSHVALSIAYAGGELGGGVAPAGTQVSLVGERWLLNPGSVGQPRDGDARAAWLLLDLDDNRAWFRREDYDVEGTQAEIRERGLPGALAERLALGI